MAWWVRYGWLLLLIFVVACGSDPDAGAGTAAPAPSTRPASPPVEVSSSRALAHIEKHQAAYGIGSRENFMVTQVMSRAGRAHVRIQQTLGVVPVFGGEGIVHLDEAGDVWRVTDRFVKGLNLADLAPRLTETEAAEKARAASECRTCALNPANVELWVLRHEKRDRLVYRVQAPLTVGKSGPTMPVFFVDAADGSIVWQYENLQTGTGPSVYSGNLTLDTYRQPATGTYFLQDVERKLGTFDMRHTNDQVFPFTDADDVWDDPEQRAALDAQYGMLKTLEYYRTLSDRLGVDGNGGPLTEIAANGMTRLFTSRVHYLSNYNNAFWNGAQMTYGDGNGVNFGPFTTLDVCGHEITHGLTQFTANLVYAYESGALNEASSDIMGAMVERFVRGESDATWQLNEEGFTPQIPGDAMRDMADPHRTGSPDHYSERLTGPFDNGGVHFNSGIANKAFYLMSRGGPHHLGGSIDAANDPPSENERAIGADKAAAIWYLALTGFMTSTTDFAAGADATADAAQELYGPDSPEVRTVLKAWAMCGVTPDREPPVARITAPTANATVSETVAITAEATDNVGMKAVEFYVDDELRSTVTTPPYRYDWQTWLDGNGPHELVIKAYDLGNNVATSDPVPVVVANETVEPVVSITSPTNGAIASGTTTASISATDNVAVTSVELWVDGNRRAVLTTPPYEASWQTWLDGNGPRVLTAKAFDPVGNVGTSAPVSVTVSNEAVPPVVNMAAPRNGNVLTGLVSFQANASDNSGVVDRIEFFVDGMHVGTRTGANANFGWDSASADNGTHVVVAKAFDMVQNSTSSAPATVTVSNPDRAVFDAATGVLTCPTIASACDSGGGLTGRGPLGPEPHAPNTIGGTCPDGAAGEFHVDGSVDRIRVSTVDGAPFEAGKRVRAMVSYWGRTPRPGETLVMFVASGDLAAPVWTKLQGLGLGGVLPGARVYPFEFTPQRGALHAVRAVLVSNHTESLQACALTDLADRDDLVFAVGDTIAPTVSITSPAAEGEVVFGTSQVEATVTDNGELARVEFSIDGTLLATRTIAPFVFPWNTALHAPGTHQIEIRAVDSLGNAASAARTVTVFQDSEPPSVALTEPAPGSTLTGTVTVAGTVTDAGSPVSEVSLFRDGLPVGTATIDGSAFTFSWETTKTANGSFSLTARATDAQGNAATSAPVPLTASNPGVVTYSAAWRAPVCNVALAVCDSLELLNGRGAVGPEPNFPNTLASSSCADGASGQYHVDESIDRIRIYSPTGGPAEAGKPAIAEVTLWGTGDANSIALYLIPDPSNPTFLHYSGRPFANGGHQVLQMNFVAGNNPLQAVRAVIQRNNGNYSTCGTGATDDHDDLVFALADFTAPQTTIIQPEEGATVSGDVFLIWSVFDNGLLETVDLTIDGVRVAGANLNGSFGFHWNSRVYANGPHTMLLRAVDRSGHVSEATRNFNVFNAPPPIATIVAPLDDAWVSGTVPVRVTATSPAGVITSVTLLVNDLPGPAKTAPPFDFSWDTTNLPDGPYFLRARVVDSLGGMSESMNVNLMVDNTPPSASITSPAGGSTLSGTVTVTASVSDPGALVSSVDFLLDGAVVHTQTDAGPYAWPWNTATASPGAHSLAVRATDFAGNQSTSANVAVTVAAPCAPVNGTGNGLRGEYFDNSNLTAWRANRDDATVNFGWGTGAPMSGIGTETFSVRWTGDVQPRFSGTYTFSTTFNDGVRLWVNNQQIINDWTNRTNEVTRTGAIALTAGQRYAIRMEYYDNTGAATARLSWQSACEPLAIVPTAQLYRTATGTGLKGEYFDNSNPAFTGTRILRTDSTVNFTWSGSPISNIAADTFSVRWTGEIEVPSSETYTFYTTSDDGVRLWVNNQQLVNNWTNHAATENSGTITLTGGQRYSIRLEHYDNTGSAQIRLSWSSLTIPKQVIPAARLFPAP